MSDNQVIPEAAVEAAAKALCDMSGIPWNPYLFENHAAQAALEAAAPIMRQAFFLEMNLRAVEEELRTPFR